MMKYMLMVFCVVWVILLTLQFNDYRELINENFKVMNINTYNLYNSTRSQIERIDNNTRVIVGAMRHYGVNITMSK